jgi:transposase
MQVLYQRCAAVDVGKDVIAVAVRLPGDGPDGRRTIKRAFKTFYGVLAEAARSMGSLGVTHVAMEATGIYSMPACHALAGHGDFEKVLVCNAGHVRNVPGRKTDFSGAAWLVHLLGCGLLAGSFIPPAEIKAARDVIRYRTKVARQRVSEIARLGNVLQDAGIKIDSVACSIATQSGRAMIGALTGGERRGPVLARLAKGRMRVKIPDLSMALEGRFGGHHALMCRLHLDHTGHLEAMIKRLDAQAGAMMTPFQAARDLLATAPGTGQLAAAVISGIGADVQEFFPGDARLASWTGLCPGTCESAGKRRSGRRRKGQPAPAVPAGRVRLARSPPGRVSQVALPPARDEMGRLPQPGREEESHRRGRTCPGRDHLAHPGHREALPRTRCRLLHPPPGPRTGNPPADRQARSPRPHRHPPASRLTAHP